MSSAGLRNEAKLRGDIRYFTGKPCIRNHISERTVSSGGCLVCAKAKIAMLRKKRTPEQLDVDHLKSRIRSAEWRINNPDHENTKLAKLKYKKSNIDKTNAGTAKRRAEKLKRTPKWLSADDFWMIGEAYAIAALRTKMFGFSWHVDHIIPLQGKDVSGLHVPLNLQVIPWIDNVSKSNKFKELR
jgi:hypothetical protein